MAVIGGYHESTDQNHDVLKSKANRGMNFPCPDGNCILTFENEARMKKHLLEENHTFEAGVLAVSTNDRIKKSWVSGLSGNVTLRKESMYKLCM